jgi:hypothetical protein
MPLSCSCNYDDPEYWIWPPDDYSDMPARKRRTRCSCGAILNEGDLVAAFRRTRGPWSDVEWDIYGDDPEAIKLAPRYLCERCADLYFSLFELGFECIDPEENMRELVRDYARDFGPIREAQNGD